MVKDLPDVNRLYPNIMLQNLLLVGEHYVGQHFLLYFLLHSRNSIMKKEITSCL
jgi:hypothetical protein